ncbi:MAG TPA: hypothetical protein ENJ53_08865 [Phaeodactylibacter sp.]|nr:hypothetical protein [Phaeodactylibacter sp.]
MCVNDSPEGRHILIKRNLMRLTYLTFDVRTFILFCLVSKFQRQVKRSETPIRHPPSAIRRPPSVVRRPPSAVSRPPSAVRRPPSAPTSASLSK